MTGTAPMNSMSASARTRLAIIGGTLLAVLLLAAGIWWYTAGRESTDDAQVDGHIVPIAPRVGGTVLEVPVESNQRVEKGALLVQIDQRDYRIALLRAQADLADAEASLEAARSGVPITSTITDGQLTSATATAERARMSTTIAEKEIDAARARLAGAQARLKEARANDTRVAHDLDRMKQLVAKDEVSRQQYDATVAASEAAKAAVEVAQAAITEAEQGVLNAESRRLQSVESARQSQADLRSAQTAPAQVNVTRARFSSAEARLQMAQAAVAQAELNLKYTTILAPAAGIVSRKSVEPGQVVQPGQPVLALVQLDETWVTANFKETQLTDMRVGQTATLAVDSTGHTYSGKVESLAAATGARFSLLPPENATGNFVKVVQRIPVKIVFDKGQDAEHVLRPGMSVVATVKTR
jgi:membrane fusion protein (multidrug efflux system)